MKNQSLSPRACWFSFVVFSLYVTAFALEEPIYTVTTSGTGTNDITAAVIEVTENGETTTKSFSEISFTTGTIRKRGTGFLRSDASLVSFTGTILVEEGAWLATANGHLGYSVHPYASSANVVISNGASVVYAIPAGSTAQFRQAIQFGGPGYRNMGAICIENNVAGEIAQFFWNTRWTMTDDATIAYHNTKSTVTGGYLVINMQHHTLTMLGYGNGTGSTFITQYSTFENPGDIVLDGARWQYRIDAVGTSGRVVRHLTGSSANTITLKKGTVKANESWFTMNGMDPTSPWTIISHEGGVLRATHGFWGSTNLAAWAGPVELADGMTAVSGAAGVSFTFYNEISGAGGLSCSRGQQVTLANGGNSFTGEVRINTGRKEGEGELRLFADGALPANGAGATLYDSSLELAGYRGTYHLPSLRFDVGSGLAETFRGGTNGVVQSLRKSGAGTLDVSAPVTVTGVTEIAAGMLRIPYVQAGLIAGGLASVPENYPSDQLSLIDTLVLTNRVALGTDLAYTDEAGYWLRDQVTWGGRALFTYHGYLWNRSGAAQNWTFALNISQGATLYLNGEAVANLWATDYRVNTFVRFKTISVPPGANRFDLRIYSTGIFGPSYDWNEYRNGHIYKKNSKSGESLAWKPNFGFAIDTQGRESTDAEDYVAVTDPGDGSLFTVSVDGLDDGVSATLPKFDHLKFTGGTLDTRGSDITVPVLEGVNGTVTNSNAYFPGGSLTVGEAWRLSGSAVSGKTLKIYGKLKFAAGAALDWEDLALLPRAEHTLATATDGIEGLPAFDSNAPGKKGWHLVKETVNGVESLKLFWKLGTMFTIR